MRNWNARRYRSDPAIFAERKADDKFMKTHGELQVAYLSDAINEKYGNDARDACGGGRAKSRPRAAVGASTEVYISRARACDVELTMGSRADRRNTRGRTLHGTAAAAGEGTRRTRTALTSLSPSYRGLLQERPACRFHRPDARANPRIYPRQLAALAQTTLSSKQAMSRIIA